jgi:hypothetical protein
MVALIRPPSTDFEAIEPFCIAPWKMLSKDRFIPFRDKEKAKQQAKEALQTSQCIFADGALKDDKGGIAISTWVKGVKSWGFNTAVRVKDNANAQLLELSALRFAAHAAEISALKQQEPIILLPDCQSVLQAIQKPARQSGQEVLTMTIKVLNRLVQKGFDIRLR